MDPIYPRFARADPLFYELPDRAPDVSARFEPDPELDWSGWTARAEGGWMHHAPRDHRLPAQGWKIHASATLDSATAVLRATAVYCHTHGLPFKHLPTRGALFASNAKEADRAASGKFVTIYPRDVDELERALASLEASIGGLPGPYILSDLRWNEGPLYVRYGAFARRVAQVDGREVLVVEDHRGSLVEDVRSPAFTPPEWVELPPSLRAQRARLRSDPPSGMPRITRALHFSNAGGVYEATDDASGDAVILKESRPHAGLTPDGRDAVARSVDEEEALRALAGADVVAVRGAMDVHGHRFLCLDRVPGVPLNTAVASRHPLVRAHSAPTADAEYRQWALGIADRLTATLERIHRAGYAHGDLHPGNVIIGPGDDIVVIDFEMATRDDGPARIGAPGFVPPDPRSARAADRYALACIKIFLFSPLTPLIALDPRKAQELLADAATVFALDPAWVAAVIDDLDLPAPPVTVIDPLVESVLEEWPTQDARGLRTIEHLVADGIIASADFSRTDRLWPGDPQQFVEHGIGLAHGAAGVIHALHAAGVGIDPAALAWLDEASATPAAALRPGLFDGLAGVSWLNRQLGRDELADAQLQEARRVPHDTLGADLYGGLPGIGLALLAAAQRDSEAVADAVRIAETLRVRRAERGAPTEEHTPVKTGAGGLMRGATGTALFALRLHRHTGDPTHLALAQSALDEDLAHCVPADDGSLQVDEGWRLLPYLAAGSAGIGLVAAEFLRHGVAEDRHAQAVAGIRDAALARFVIEPGLFQGRAGLIAFLLALEDAGAGTPETTRAIDRHAASLRLHALRGEHGVFFPGQGLLRRSCDLATGSAGILLTLAAIRHRLDNAASAAIALPLLWEPGTSVRRAPHPTPAHPQTREEVTR